MLARHTRLLSLVAVVPLSLGAQSPGPGSDPIPDIETVGVGERRVVPDRAAVMLFVQTKATTAAPAAAANARAVAAVRDTLRKLGVDSGVTTASYHVGPDYDVRPVDRDGRPRPVGYSARTVVRVPLTRLDQIGRVIDAGLARGATGVEGVSFESSTAEQARREALAEAAAAARRDAEALARALGGSIGALLNTSTAGGNDSRRLNVMMRSANVGYAGSSTQITPNEIVVSAAVVTRWRFMPGGR
jgi:uncharacterized protein YggE